MKELRDDDCSFLFNDDCSNDPSEICSGHEKVNVFTEKCRCTNYAAHACQNWEVIISRSTATVGLPANAVQLHAVLLTQ